MDTIRIPPFHRRRRVSWLGLMRLWQYIVAHRSMCENRRELWFISGMDRLGLELLLAILENYCLFLWSDPNVVGREQFGVWFICLDINALKPAFLRCRGEHHVILIREFFV